MTNDISDALASVSATLEADIIFYNSDIDMKGADALINIASHAKNKNALLLLCTSGGDANAAYKIARCLQSQYEKFFLYVYGWCKSAGTLIAVGSDEIIMSDYAELGPLDVQLKEKDEIFNFSSGLNIDESLRTLQSETLRFFRLTMLELAGNMGISTRTAAELATNLSVGYVSPLVAQVDPIRVAETNRAVKIAVAYGERLAQAGRGNLRSKAELAKLVQGYPDHGFVIDFEETKTIFKKVRKHTDNEKVLGELLKDALRAPLSDGKIERLFPKEDLDGQLDKQQPSKGTGKIARSASKGNTEDSAEIVDIEQRKEAAGSKKEGSKISN